MVIDLEMDMARARPEGPMDADIALDQWEHFPASRIAHHGQACCELARDWMLGMDFSQLNGGNTLTGPRWLRQKFKWGPSRWPMHWCEAVREKTLDCGALAALSHELFLARGVRSFPVQFVLEFNDVSAQHWQATWSRQNTCSHWIGDGLIYHEGCAVAVGEKNAIKVWDATATWWVNPKQFGGYAGVLAVRIFAEAQAAPFTWGAHSLPANTWHKLERARNDFAKPERRQRKRARARKKATTVASVAA